MPNTSERPARADARRNAQRILDATAEALADDPATNLDAIAQRAGVTRATLYAHFPSREALIDALTLRSVDEVTAALIAARPGEGTAVEALERVLIAAWGTIGRYRGLVVINQRRDPAELRARTAPAIELIMPLIARGQRDGEFDPELPADWLVSVLLDLIHSASRQVTAGTMDAEAAQRVLLRSAAAVLGSHRVGGS